MSNVILKKDSVAWKPQEGPQTLSIQCPAFELLMGGAVGGGKTDFLLGDFAADLELGSKWKGVYFRRHFPDMDDVIHRSMEIFGPVYGEKCYSGSKYQWNFPNGAILQFRALEKNTDVYKYQGQQYSWVGWDELTQWPDAFPYTYLMTRIRSAKGVKRLRVRAATNPGGPGHAWVKSRFVDPMQPGQALKVQTKSGDHYWRVFIPSKLEDNKILMDNDPGYGDRVYEINDPILADALRNGRWDIVAGAAFPEFDPKVHVIDPITPPSDKPIIRGLDWGYKEPYAGLWCFPHDGDLIIFHELYGWSGTPNVGTEEDPAVVRQKIENYEALSNIYVPKGLLDGQCWEQRGNAGGRLVDLLGGKALGWRKWDKGPNSRVNQKQVLHSLLAVQNGDARLKITRDCHHLIRTLPILPSCPKNREDVDTTAEDHLYDTARALANEKLPTREQIRMRAMRRRMESSGMDIDLPGGGF